MSISTKLDPLKPESFNHKYAWINGIRYHYVDEGQGPLVVLCHGFPDMWYGWRYQIPYLVARNYRVIVPDFRGYGETDAPYVKPGDVDGLKAYGLKNICKDLAELLDHVGGKGTSAIFIGHDWGGMTVWRMCLHYPERVKAVAAICTAFSPPNTQYIALEQLVKTWPQFQYQIWFTDPATDEELDNNVSTFLRNIYRGVGEDTALVHQCSLNELPRNLPLSSKLALSEQEFEYYCRQFARRSFHGGLNYYRTRRVNFDDERDCPREVSHQALMIVATADPALPVSMARKMNKYVKNMELKTIEAAHWVQMERTAELNEMLAEWLSKLSETKAKL
ncbi:uncharacterized protein SPPG_08436 [Spizellomyces punctatus DAOM BR117]|uniref:AB hydrolase-1 domain-containing protein n=1 Tax=Spizellomyces punctatus (strain DAOM BR117) TaxID=645134 RepID=A0A0L0H5P0_SPIPD|nr:uncharacterized protein SPPG_08436 [Spizellomyces punctatus DAOM BR117]KNC96284.1 hypothetical protein SPPG_08436 [Spizellomyces punctatus DAOM BR117]|eukprot:XP_016604324.1 hypothetical protein SPPG_08436 [Spizellomyces punctatus DAOM BR117]